MKYARMPDEPLYKSEQGSTFGDSDSSESEEEEDDDSEEEREERLAFLLNQVQ